jgi:hypothetical protein
MFELVGANVACFKQSSTSLGGIDFLSLKRRTERLCARRFCKFIFKDTVIN